MLIREMCCATDIGTVRRTNQDSVAVFPEMKLAVLADGMGGHLAGEVASRKANWSTVGERRDTRRETKSIHVQDARCGALRYARRRQR